MMKAIRSFAILAGLSLWVCVPAFAQQGAISGGAGSGVSLSAPNTWTATQTFSPGTATAAISATDPGSLNGVGFGNATVVINKGTGTTSALDIQGANLTGSMLRIFIPGTSQIGNYIDNGGNYFSRLSMTISGHTTGNTINPPTADPYMIGCWSDITGPCIQIRANVGTTGERLIDGLDNSGNYTFSLESNGSLQFGRSSTRAAMDAFFSSPAAATFRFGAAPAAAPVAQNIVFQDVVTGTNNTAGVNATYTASLGTGSAAGGAFVWKAAPAATSGTTPNAAVEYLRVTPAITASAGPVQISGGGLSVPQLTFVPNSGSGVSFGMANSGSQLAVFSGSSIQQAFNGVAFSFRSDGIVQFGNSTNALSTMATSLSRNADGVLQAGTGAANASGSIIAASLQTGGASLLTLTAGAHGMAKMTASASAPGAAGGKIELVCGTNAGSAKLIAYAGTSSTAATILDNIGSGVTGC